MTLYDIVVYGSKSLSNKR